MPDPSLPRSPATTTGSGRTVSWLLDLRASERPRHPFVIWEPFSGPSRTFTYGELADSSARMAAGLRRRGIAAGDRVLIHLQNCPEFLIAYFACMRIGAVAVCTNTRSALDELVYYAEHSQAVAAITQPSLAPLVHAAMPSARFVAVTATNAGEVPEPGSAPETGARFDTLLADDRAEPAPCNAFDAASIQYTSGTTGRPKAVVWTHANALWGAKVNASNEGLTQDDIQLAYLPLFHTNAQAYALLATLWAGSTMVLQPRFSASRYWDVSVRNRCTANSHIYFALRVLGQQDAPTEHSYRFWGTGMCHHPVVERFGISTVGWWGMTETIAHPIIGELGMPNRPGSMGRAAAEYEIAVVDDGGEPVEPDTTGNLLVRGVRGVSLFAEYLYDEAATAAAFDEHGWFRTGDLVTVHGDGSMSFADRAKDMLKIGAENVAASEIERVIAQVPGVKEVAVVGQPHELLSEVPVAFVLAPGAPPSLAAEVLAACERSLADFKVPREVRVVDELPRATLEKVAKGQLRAQLIEESEPTPGGEG